MSGPAHPAYEVLRPVSEAASVLLENNPSSMTLEGTNTWVLRAPGAEAAVLVDPGYHDLAHLEPLAGLGPVELILLTHHHGDHAEGAPWLAARTGAPVRALDPALCLPSSSLPGSSQPAPSLVDGERITAAGLELRVLHTPGHTADSVSLVTEHAGRTQVLTGDTVLGHGTTVLDDLGAYLGSLRALLELPEGALGLPGHGPELTDLRATVEQYLRHREQRLDQVRAALRTLGQDATARQVVELVYAEVDRALWEPAEYSVRAQLDYLRGARD